MWTDLVRWLRGLRGRLIAVSLVMVVGIIGGVVGYSTTSPYYTTQGTVIVMPPGAGSIDAGQNPFANLFNSTQFTAVVATKVRSEEIRDRVVAASGARRGYIIETVAREVRANFAQNVAQIDYAIDGDEPGAAERGSEALVAAIRDAVRSIQADAGVPTDRMAKVQVAVPAPAAHEVTGDLVIAALIFGTVAALAAVLIALLTWRAIPVLRADRGTLPARLSLRSRKARA
ncbi:hypothetical protein [Tsukamurella ocularis]|uniref:hypothetical protein n=1 Tax=Tsukamurella ocularis TaxID=1970234 RepID=UPI00216703E7|nr:hypothetical protein [Tsukamurella ocularis]MCS3779494.1 hypothetical protein [Tsukamurella ocularis]MCS3788033.1 hypothetical protein [Tsukamurella ocularis]MCS3852349.1 hypothetical protein [Tsukamurella ocularis]